MLKQITIQVPIDLSLSNIKIKNQQNSDPRYQKQFVDIKNELEDRIEIDSEEIPNLMNSLLNLMTESLV